MSPYTILTRETLIARTESLLRSPHPTQSGPARAIIGQLIPLPAQAASLFIMRVRDREKAFTRRALQAVGRFGCSKPGRIYGRAWYRCVRQRYAIAAIDWRTCQVVELSSFSTKAEALVALRR